MKFKILSFFFILLFGFAQADEVSITPPDLTKSANINRKETYNLGATGMRGWIHTKAACDLDSWQGRTTDASRQILVTHVGKKSPADKVMKVNDVILGVSGKLFSEDARKSIAKAIQQAETEKGAGALKLMIWRNGKAEDVVLELRVMGTYGPKAPYDCPKSTVILQDACDVLEKEPLTNSWTGAITGLALLSTGDAKYLPKLRKYAKEIAPRNLKLVLEGTPTWYWGYINLFLCEYYLLTGDNDVLPAIQTYTIALAKGQGTYGTFGHGLSDLTEDGQLHGPIPPYGPVNAAGLVANISIVMGKNCGVKDPEVDGAIYRASGFFAYYMDKGSIPYGEHMPWPSHENNGKTAMAAMLFCVQGNKPAETKFFAKMETAAYNCREYGHTGQGFSYLWGALGANAGGPAALGSFFSESSWHFDLVRRCDGSFTYDGAEQYGAGETDDNTYYGHSSYNGISPTATYVLSYATARAKIRITGRDNNTENWLSAKDIEEANYSGKFDLVRKTLKPDELVEAFGDWSPIVRGWAAEELSKRKQAGSYTRRLITMAEGADGRKRQGAAEALGYIGDSSAAKVLAKLLTHEDRWLRVKAAEALKRLGGGAKSVIPELLKAVADTAEPLYPVVWKDPIQLTHGQLAETLFGGLLANSIDGISTNLLYPAIRAVAQNPDAMARGTLGGTFGKLLSNKDITALAPDLVEAVMIPAPADSMFRDGIRMGALQALTKNFYQEGLDAGMEYLNTQGGHGSQVRTGEILGYLAKYGTAAKPLVPSLRKLKDLFEEQTKRDEFPAAENKIRVEAIEDSIKSILAAKDQPPLKMITMSAASATKRAKLGVLVIPTVPEKPVPKVVVKKIGIGEMAILTTPEGADLPASAVLKDFPLLVRLSKDQFDFSQVKSNGDDIRFTDAAGIQLPYQIEEWNAESGTASIWVRIPSIKGNSKQNLRMLWGVEDAASKSEGRAVFNDSNGYSSVWHMDDSMADEVAGVKFKDNKIAQSNGAIGKGRKLAMGEGLAVDNLVTYPVGSSAHTTEAWFRTTKASGGLVAWGNDRTNEKMVLSLKSPSRLNVDTYSSSADVSGGSQVGLNEWTHVSHTYENGDSRVYLNGVLDGTSTAKNNPLNIVSPCNLEIGGWLGKYNFAGDIDEIRVSKVKRSADWIKLEYENQKAMQTVVGHFIKPGTDFGVIPQNLTLDEGTSETVSGEAGGALKVYWILKSKGGETVIGTNQFSISLDVGRISGDQDATLQFKAIYAQGVKTKEIPITMKEMIPDPQFTLQAPAEWDARSKIEVVPQISNLADMKGMKLADLKISWKVENIATSQQIMPDRLVLQRAEKSGPMVVSATISNGGLPVTKSVILQVKEPKREPWLVLAPRKNEQPEENQFYARDAKNEGTIIYNGALTELADSVFLKVYANGKLYHESKSKQAEDRSFGFAVKIRPGLIRYSVEFGASTGGKETVLKSVGNLICGDAYLISGQSNAQATSWGDKEFTDTSEWIMSFGGNGENPKSCRWGPAVRRSKDDQLAIGYWGFDLAKSLLEKQKVPICIINGAVGGTRIDLHQRDADNDQNFGSIYGRLLWRVRQAKLTHGVRAIFWHQGENDQGADGPSGSFGWQDYRQNFFEMAAAWKQDYPNLQHYYTFQIRPFACSMGVEGSDDRLREVQRKLPGEYSELSVMSTLGINPPGDCHYTPEGYAEMAKLILPLVEQCNYGVAPSQSITPPNLTGASYVSATQDEVLLEFDQPVKWENTSADQISFGDHKGKVVSGMASGNTLKLKLAASTKEKSITYITGSRWKQDNLIRGKNGIAALSFCEVPIVSVKK